LASCEGLNRLPREQAIRELLACCGSRAWAERMAAARPFRTIDALLEAADGVWHSLRPDDWLEAFRAHPRIGEQGKQRWSQQEQSGAADASADIKVALAEANRLYEERFGYIFIVCATGKTAAEMLRMARERLGNDPGRELRVAAEEQRQITRLRLQKLVAMAAITTHVLDTTRGKPAAGIPVSLEFEGKTIGAGATDENGRLAVGSAAEPGNYRLVFDTARYFRETFYPTVTIVFRVHNVEEHYHVPLLVSPYGYTTYRGA